jgi:hypothetical protein
MRALSKAIVLVACLSPLLGEGKVATQRSLDRLKQGRAALIPRSRLVRSPVHLPPRPDPIVVSLGESLIDEEESDGKAEAFVTPAPLSFDLHAPMQAAARGSLAFEPPLSYRLMTIASILRC